jgi:large subunit ribosomal protein L18
MKSKSEVKRAKRQIRKFRIRKQISGVAEKPRLTVFRSSKFTYAQLIADDLRNTLLSLSTRTCCAEGHSPRSVESAKLLGQKIAELAKSKNIEAAVFDRNGYIYHGRVKAVAEGVREGGIKI